MIAGKVKCKYVNLQLPQRCIDQDVAIDIENDVNSVKRMCSLYLLER